MALNLNPKSETGEPVPPSLPAASTGTAKDTPESRHGEPSEPGNKERIMKTSRQKDTDYAQRTKKKTYQQHAILKGDKGNAFKILRKISTELLSW